MVWDWQYLCAVEDGDLGCVFLLSVRLPISGRGQNANHLYVLKFTFSLAVEVCGVCEFIGQEAQFTSEKHRPNLEAYYIFKILYDYLV